MSDNQGNDTVKTPTAPELERTTEAQRPDEELRDQSMRVEAQEEHVNPNIQMGTQSPGLSPVDRDSGARETSAPEDGDGDSGLAAAPHQSVAEEQPQAASASSDTDQTTVRHAGASHHGGGDPQGDHGVAAEPGEPVPAASGSEAVAPFTVPEPSIEVQSGVPSSSPTVPGAFSSERFTDGDGANEDVVAATDEPSATNEPAPDAPGEDA